MEGFEGNENSFPCQMTISTCNTWAVRVLRTQTLNIFRQNCDKYLKRHDLSTHLVLMGNRYFSFLKIGLIS